MCYENAIVSNNSMTSICTYIGVHSVTLFLLIYAYICILGHYLMLISLVICIVLGFPLHK